MTSLIDIFRLMRVVNCLLAMLAVWVGAYMITGRPTYFDTLVAGLSIFFICAAGNILNDLIDRPIDRINRPSRVLVTGKVSPRQAYYLLAICAIPGLLLSVAVNVQVFMIALFAASSLVVYNFGLKKVPLLGNALIATLAGLMFFTGGFAADPELALALPGPIIPAIFAFLIHLDREILKDIQDMCGDEAVGIRTLPMIIGTSRSLILILGIFLILVLGTLYPFLAGWYGQTYKIITVYIIDLPMLVLLIFVWGNPTPRMLTITSIAFKVIMALGLIALIKS